jgi:anaerobic selenocysteine-containing dehydrogenase
VMLVGANPLVSHATAGCLVADPVKTLKREKARGLKFIVIDPRKTESAAFADLFLQPYPGEDPAVISGLLRLLLTEGWANEAFLTRHVVAGGVDRLREMVAPFDPDYVAARAGIDADDLRLAARMFGEAASGSAFSGTGPSMAPRANLSEHLIELLNVVCGRYRQPGDLVRDVNIFAPPRPVHAEVVPPYRGFEKVPPSRIRGAGSIWGEKMTSTLPDEILTPGPGQVRALLNGGGNPANSCPDQRKVVDALSALDLFVTIGPHLNSSARLSHYVFAPKLQYERADIPMLIYDMSFYPMAWGQYTPGVVAPPPGSELIDDWYLFWGIAKRLGLKLDFQDVPIDMETAPTTEELLAIRTAGSLVPLDEIKSYPGGHVFDVETRVQAGRAEAEDNKFDPMPEDVAAVLAEVAAEATPARTASARGFTHLLQVRRIRESNNSTSVGLQAVKKRMPYNWASMNPGDLEAMQLKDGAKVTITSDHGFIPAVVKGDDTVREGVLVMTHGWGGLPNDAAGYEQIGANVNQLISNETHVEPINAMVRMSAIPVNISTRA